MDEMFYKGYLIEADPDQLAESGEWKIRVNIYRRRRSGIGGKPFIGKDRFKTKEEAIQHCFHFGKLIVDGKIENCNVDDL